MTTSEKGHGEGTVTIMAIIKGFQEKGPVLFPLLSKPPLSHKPAVFTSRALFIITYILAVLH